MTLPLPSSQNVIRPGFLIAHFRRHDAAWSERGQLIAERDDKHRELNRAYGYRDADGSIPIGSRSHVDQDYKHRYDAISTKFQTVYDGVTTATAAADRADGMTIFEFLVLDDIETADREAFLVAASRPQTAYFIPSQADFIALRAWGEVVRKATGHTVNSAKYLVPMLIDQNSYAVARCRKAFGLPFWDIPALQVIRSYRGYYKRAVRDAAKNLRLSG